MCFEEHTISKDKYQGIFSRQMESIVLQHIESRDAFRPMASEGKYLMDCKAQYSAYSCYVFDELSFLLISVFP